MHKRFLFKNCDSAPLLFLSTEKKSNSSQRVLTLQAQLVSEAAPLSHSQTQPGTSVLTAQLVSEAAPLSHSQTAARHISAYSTASFRDCTSQSQSDTARHISAYSTASFRGCTSQSQSGTSVLTAQLVSEAAPLSHNQAHQCLQHS